eukprot:3179152-Karenia_brevis.AAC.1
MATHMLNQITSSGRNQEILKPRQIIENRNTIISPLQSIVLSQFAPSHTTGDWTSFKTVTNWRYGKNAA